MFTHTNNYPSATQHLLNQPIVAASTYDNTAQCLQAVYENYRSNSAPQAEASDNNSLKQAWNTHKQTQWNHYKQASITLAIDYLKEKKQQADILVLYALLADCRRIIAANLGQKKESGSNFLGVARPSTSRNMRDCRDMTYLRPEGVYQSFYEPLNKKFTELSHDTDEININVDGHCVTKLHRDENQIAIVHCDEQDQSFKILANKIHHEFQTYLASTSKDEALESIGHLVYYFTLAMPLIRGSAACVEMMSQALMQHKGLFLNYQDKDGIIMDLRAYFSQDINEFTAHFSTNHLPSKHKQVHIDSGLFLTDKLIDKIQAKIKIIESETNHGQKPAGFRVEKIATLKATIDFLNDNINSEQLQQTLLANPQYDKALFTSETKELVDAALTLKGHSSVRSAFKRP